MAGAWPKGVNVIAIVPAYNEAKYVGKIVGELKQRKGEGLVQEIVVVDDGSSDGTSAIAKKAGADKVIRLRKNYGKARAFGEGVKYCAKKYSRNSIVLTLDADIREINQDHIKQMVEPLVKRPGRKSREISMVVGRIAIAEPRYSGQRAIKLKALGGLIKGTKLWKRMLKSGYGLERTLEHLIRDKEVTSSHFSAARPRQNGLRGDVLTREMLGAKIYWGGRKQLAEHLSKQRKQIKLLGLSAKNRRELIRMELKKARITDRGNVSKMLQQIREVRKRARRK